MDNGHPHHATGTGLDGLDHEAQLRMLRFASIDLQKFWVDIQSFPVFLNTVKGASIQELGVISEWMQASPAWHQRSTINGRARPVES